MIFVNLDFLRAIFIIKNHIAPRGVREKEQTWTINDFIAQIKPLYNFVKV